MDSLSCGPSGPYSAPEPLVCQAPPPETLVCEAPPAAPMKPVSAAKPKTTAPRDQFAQSSSSGSSAVSHTFLDEAGQVCRDPASVPASLNLPSARLDPALFSATLANSQVVATLDLELHDRDGLQRRSPQDIQGTIHSGTVGVSGDLFAPALQALKGTRRTSGDTTTVVKDARFDAATRSYVIDLEVTKRFWKLPVWDNFQVRFQANAQGQLTAQLDQNWFPDAQVLEQLEASIRQTVRDKIPPQYQALRLDTTRQDNALVLQPQLKQIDIPLGQQGQIHLEQIDSAQARLRLDGSGNLHVDLQNVAVSGSSSLGGSAPPVSAGTPDRARFQVQLGVGKDGSRQALTQGRLQVQLDESETPEIKLGHDRLVDYLKSGELDAELGVYVKQQPGQAAEVISRSRVQIRQADLGQGTQADLQTALQLDFDGQNGLRLTTPQHHYAPLQVQTTDNGVEFLIDGKQYFPEMKRLIASAQESVALETYMFTDDAVGREIAELLARKAAGLAVGAATPRLNSARGIDVRFIFNSWKGNAPDGAASERLLTDAKNRISAEIQGSGLSPADKAQAVANLERNLNWTFFSEGILRSDHRKVLVVDGSQATVGGMNLGQHYLGDAGYHDVMVKMAGPEVQNVHREFLENWYAFRHETPPENWREQLRSPERLQANLESLQSQGQYRTQAGVQTLVTDDRQVDIERGLISLIDGATREINIQQAFFADERINAHLADAIRRGVTVNVIVAEDPLAPGVFKAANLLSAYQLAQAQQASGTGQIHFHTYADPAGGERNHIHTKAISVDGNRAMIGSANMIGRSLSSPFAITDADGQLSQAMYNKEMSLLLEGAAFVEEIDQRLFQQDMQHRSRVLDAAGIVRAVEAAGGEAELRKQALAAPFT
ncbi:MAG: phospholipase D-like domain-containing protein [Candidatus Sericytochromatia bacterium]